MSSRVAVFRQPGQSLELREIDLPPLAVGEVRVAIEYCTICGSDLHTIRGTRAVAGPTVLGHEIIGRVEEVAGESPLVAVDGKAISVGDRITWSIACSCRECFFCNHGLPQKCAQLFKYGHEALSSHAPTSGGLAEHCTLRGGTSIVKLPLDMPSQVACPANCATATVAAAFRTANEVRDQAVLVIGAGMLGLTATAWAREAGAREVLVSDPNPNRRQLALKFGATHACTPEEISTAIAHATDDRGADVAFDMSGVPKAIEAAIGQLRIGGSIVLVGSVFPAAAIAISPERIVRRMLRIEGVHNYTPGDLVAAVAFLDRTRGHLAWGELVGAEYPLEEINRAVEHALEGSVARVGIRP